jgi:hypothetical protein
MSHGISTAMQNGLAVFFLLVAILNAGFAIHFGRENNERAGWIWGLVAAGFLLLAALYAFHSGPAMPLNLRHVIDWLMGPVVYTTLSVVGFVLLLVFRRFIAQPQVGLALMNLTFLFSGLAMTDPHFGGPDVMGKADNVPIAMLIYSVGFFTWVALFLAVRNDERLAKGDVPVEKLEDEKVLVWPDLVYTELICMVIATFVLVIWAVLLKAPLEQPATSAKAPNPSKAPWYFLGLQEMLVYFDPWMAGVVLPTMIIVGLIAIPYIDINQKGSGYYTFNERPFAITTFLFGFLVLWVTLIVMGTFLRGPNWNFFGPFQTWDPHKVDPLLNVNVSEIFWLKWMGRSLQGMNPVVRELPGILLVFVYLVVLPPLLARTLFKGLFLRMGFVRYMVLITLLQFMAALPIKMVLRWTLNLKYIVYLPEIFFNI